MAPNGLKRLNPHRKWYGLGSLEPQDLVHGRAADHAARLVSRKNEELQKKAPNALKSLDAELKSAPAFRERKTPR